MCSLSTLAGVRCATEHSTKRATREIAHSPTATQALALGKSIAIAMCVAIGVYLPREALSEGRIGASVPISEAQVRSPAFHVPIQNKRDLQSLLDHYGSILLDPNQDYRSDAVPTLIVSSHQHIVGGWNTRVPRMIIPGGVSDVFISNVRCDAQAGPDIVFTGGTENNDITIIGGSGGAGTNIRVRIGPGTHINRLGLTEYGGLEVFQHDSGYIRDSVFTRLLGYWAGPQVFWQGNTREPSRGNTFVHTGAITPEYGSSWTDPGDLWFVEWGSESWNGSGKGSIRPFTISGATRVTSIALNGGTSYPENGGALAAFHNVGFVNSWFTHGDGGAIEQKRTAVFDNVTTAFFVQNDSRRRIADIAAPRNAVRLRLLDLSGQSDQPERGAPPSQLNDAQRLALLSGLLGPAKSTSPHKPVRRSLADPLGPSWRTGLAARPDSSERIQAEIDAKGIVSLPDGIYYLDKPLKLGSRNRTEGLLGRDRDGVFLVAKGDFPIIEGRGDYPLTRLGDGTRLQIILEGFTLYGGNYGINWTNEAGNFGVGAQIAFSTFSQLKFMKQRIAGVNASGIFGLDSNFWYQVDFSDMPVAIRGDGGEIQNGMTYADKQFFLDCQYQNISNSVWYWTSGRWSGGNLWKDNYYSNVGQVSQTLSGIDLLWVNCVLENIVGDVALHVKDRGTTTTRYFMMLDCLWRGRGPAVVADSLSNENGALFIDTEFAQTGGNIVARSGHQSLFAWNSQITGSARVGSVSYGLFINSRLGQFDRELQSVGPQGLATLIDRPSKPYRQVLAR